MSGIAKKTLPPGSWPGAKGGSKTAESAQSDANAAPRSAATPDMHKEGSEGQSDDASPSHYTHQKENPLEDIQEEDQPIKMTEKGQEQAANGMKEVEPKPEVDEESQAPSEERTTTETEGQDASSKTSLTEHAKKVFDQASENQPTDQARDDFLKEARSGADVTEGSARGKSEVEASQKSREAPDELASSEIQEKTATELQKVNRLMRRPRSRGRRVKWQRRVRPQQQKGKPK